MDPLRPLGRPTDGLHTRSHTCHPRSRSHLWFRPWDRLAQKRLLMHQPQHLANLGHDRQHTLQQIAVMGAVADGPQSRGRRMLLIVYFCRILDQNTSCCLLAASLVCSTCARSTAHRSHPASARSDRSLPRRLIRICAGKEALDRGDGARDGDGPFGTTHVAQMHVAKGVFGPVQARQHGARIISVLLSDGLHHSLINSTISRPENCDKQSGDRPGSGTSPAQRANVTPIGKGIR